MRRPWQTRVLRAWTTKLRRPGRVPVKISSAAVTGAVPGVPKNPHFRKPQKSRPQAMPGTAFFNFYNNTQLQIHKNYKKSGLLGRIQFYKSVLF